MWLFKFRSIFEKSPKIPGATVARLIPYHKVACSNHVVVTLSFQPGCMTSFDSDLHKFVLTAFGLVQYFNRLFKVVQIVKLAQNIFKHEEQMALILKRKFRMKTFDWKVLFLLTGNV